MPTTQDMDVKMGHGFATCGSVVYNDAESFIQTLFAGHLFGDEQ